MNINYHDRKFKPVANSDNGEVTSEMIFHYQQSGNILTCSYRGAQIVQGQLMGIVDASGLIEMSYHQVNKAGQMMTGLCTSTPEILANGKIRLHEEWRWTSGDQSHGHSTLEEV
ncbi:MAG: n-acetylglutamate synthase [Flavobacteriales bacterium]|nr:n-acetylglutamate synthase [Flavobacteriales bacterium]